LVEIDYSEARLQRQAHKIKSSTQTQKRRIKGMKRLKRVMIMLAAVATTTAATAQDKAEASVASDFVSQYIWRGQDCGNISVQPSASIGYKGLSLGAWGSVGFEKTDTKEFDLTAAYAASNFNIGITDYWFNNTADARYFMYEAHRTAHVFEANIGYNFGPVAFQWYTNFAGNDGLNKDGDRAYSSYAELSAPFRLGGLDWTSTLGASPWATTSYGCNGFAIINASVKVTKAIEITPKFSVPIFAQIATNPCSQKAYFVVGFTLKP